jgi:hypothetical protein
MNIGKLAQQLRDTWLALGQVHQWNTNDRFYTSLFLYGYKVIREVREIGVGSPNNLK